MHALTIAKSLPAVAGDTTSGISCPPPIEIQHRYDATTSSLAPLSKPRSTVGLSVARPHRETGAFRKSVFSATRSVSVNWPAAAFNLRPWNSAS